MQDHHISRPLFSGFIWRFILWHATKRPWDSSIDGPFSLIVFSDLTRLPPSDFDVLPPDYCLTVLPTVPSDCRLNKKTRPTARSSHVCRHPARPLDHLPVFYYPAYAALSTFRSAIRSPVRSPGSCSACRPLPVARAVRVSRRPPIRRYQIASQIPAETQLLSIVCSHGLASTSAAATYARVVLWKWRLLVRWTVSVWSLLIVSSTKCHDRN